MRDFSFCTNLILDQIWLCGYIYTFYPNLLLDRAVPCWSNGDKFCNLYFVDNNIHPLDIVRCRFTSVSTVHRHIWCREIGAFPRVNFSFLRVLRTSKFTQIEVASHWSMNYSCL